MNALEIRKKYLDFFEKHNHTVVASSSLIPAQDPTLLFTNAGMNQFKDCFLGKEKRAYVRAASMQKCVRAGGKHNDLDQVGYTERHLTFFEMMGNFSFGDYFKQDAINFAWNFLTKEVGLPADKLYPSVFNTDEETFQIWHKEIGIPENRITRLGEKDNFWQMGDTGPCGPCTEIYIDQGAGEGCQKPTCAPGCDCSRFTEIWNLVFMQFDRQQDGTLLPLAAKGVDTGMGFERLCMVMQKKKNIFHGDSLQELIRFVERETGVVYATSTEHVTAAFHVLADHVRSSSLLIADGCSPANDGRGYVLRKIIRRAALFAQKLSDDKKLFSKLATYFIEQMGSVFPELVAGKKLIISLLDAEIERFAENLINGQAIFMRYLEDAKKQGTTLISGEQCFKLYDTYGFPPEVTRVMALERGFTVDFVGFEKEMEKQQNQSGKKDATKQAEYQLADGMTTKFVGYETLEQKSNVQYASMHGDYAWLSTQESPFYVECGGQVNDSGWVVINDNNYPLLDLQKAGDVFAPAIMVKISTKATDGTMLKHLAVGDCVTSRVDAAIRPSTVKNHTATHMVQAALITILGGHVKQAGSLVNDKYLRFDFNHHKAMTAQEIEQVENLVNAKIQENIPTNIFQSTLEEAKKAGVISFFGEKYNPAQVRVVQIPNFSAELCGGTHASATGIIGAFKITSDTALAAGTRRIVAVTGPEALRYFQQSFSSVKVLSERFKAKPEEVVQAVDKQEKQLDDALSQIKTLKKQLLKASLPLWVAGMQQEHGVPFVHIELDDAAHDDMRAVCQELEKQKPGVYVLTAKQGDRYNFLVYAGKGLARTVNLKKLSDCLKDTLDLKSGGSQAMIQGGAPQLPAQFKQTVVTWLGTADS